MTLAADIASLNPGQLVELFEVDLRALGGQQYWFHAGTNQLAQPVQWQGLTYQPWPVDASGFDIDAQGSLPRPRLAIANVSNLISQLMIQFNDLINAVLIRRRTLAKYLDGANFPGGVNPSADSTQHLPDERWQFDRKTGEDKLQVQFELISAIDRAGAKIPRRPITTNLCSWKYRGPECGWVPGTLYDANGNVVTNPTLDTCSKMLTTGCKVRFGATAALPFGGEPGAGLVQS